MFDLSAIGAAALQEADALVVALDIEGRIVLFNPACERLTGYAADAVRGRRVWDVLIPSEESMGVRAVFADLAASDLPSSYENDWVAKSGERKRIAWRNLALTDPATGQRLIIGAGVDVTELRRSERRLDEREARLQSLLRASLDGVVTIAQDGAVTSFSVGAEALFGYKAAEVLGRNVSMLMPEPDASRHDGYIRNFLQTGEGKIIGHGREVSIRRKDGSEAPVHLMVEEGRIGDSRFFTGVVRDLSERAEMEFSLHRSEAHFESIFRAAPDPVIISDQEGVVTSANGAALSVFQCSEGDMVGRSLADLAADPSDRQAVEEWRRRAQVTPSHMEVRLRRADGEAFPARVAVALLKDHIDVVFGLVTVLRDIGEERRRDEALRQAQKMEVVGQLTGGVAHDFNNLLTVIKGNLELADAQIADDDLRGLIAEARAAVDMGASLTARLLAFARRMPLDAQVVSVNSLVVSLTELLRRTLGESIRLTTSLEPKLPLVRVDASQLQNAIMNLILNARDAMPSGGDVAIETNALAAPDAALLAAEPEASGGFVTVTVSDTGSGVPPELMRSLFSPYVTTKAEGKGSGFGLAMVYGFVKQSGGHVSVSSAPGRGASFTLYLPETRDALVEDVAPAGALEEVEAGGGATVLLSEDDDAVRATVRRQLESLGHSVIEAVDGDAALRLTEDGAAYDLLLTDVAMPGELDGPALVAAVRAHRPAVKALMMSGAADPSRLDGLGENVLRKPFTLAELAARVRSALDRRALS